MSSPSDAHPEPSSQKAPPSSFAPSPEKASPDKHTKPELRKETPAQPAQTGHGERDLPNLRIQQDGYVLIPMTPEQIAAFKKYDASFKRRVEKGGNKVFDIIGKAVSTVRAVVEKPSAPDSKVAIETSAIGSMIREGKAKRGKSPGAEEKRPKRGK